MVKQKNSGFIPYSPLQFTKLIHNIPDLTLVSLMGHPVSQRKIWHPVMSDSMRVDLILVSLMSHPVSQRKTWHPVISDSMRVDLIIVSVPLNFHVYVSSASQVLAAAL